jgi:hypothetical protein
MVKVADIITITENSLLFTILNATTGIKINLKYKVFIKLIYELKITNHNFFIIPITIFYNPKSTRK